jgi:hypothetical protein
MYRVIESLVGWRSERRGGVHNKFRIFFVANDDAGSVGVGFGERELPDIVERLFSAVNHRVMGRVINGDASLGVSGYVPKID